MRAAESFRVAWEALRVNRLRSALTMFGVVVGVAAVVVLVAIGSGARDLVEREIEGLGSNLVFVAPGDLASGTASTVSRLTLEDVEYLHRTLGEHTDIAVSLSSGETVRAGRNEAFATVVGTNEALPRVFDRPLRPGGRHLTETDVQTRRRVVVLGARTAEQIFGDVDPVGRQVAIAGGARFRVVGVFEELGETFGQTRDTELHMPVTTAQRLLGVDTVDYLALRAASADDIPALQREVVDALERRHPGERFSAISQTQLLGTVGTVLNALTGVLAAIAAISLLVGGVGVSNIMLVSVRERTREIGLRKALGARRRDVLAQFLTEAVLLTSIGGICGIALGVGGALAIAWASPVPASVAWWSPALAFAVSAAVGIFFGVVPARRAARLDPVTALRTE
ncbi:ABC transporter permease [Thermomonospora cellulosilytica]|uniref:Putative ABC transport system permease protein n=1 Tax=Thermomonospora cellulosilytica TaxID=1411118 RepID=A0A7W3R5T6_9ACTN|nr:ABC transporter permease [Thermomonospora cellulosilytica]MBA9001453.1 putative ABC transport system permease protein [Thermomonospora cellulosilytica]